jgi:lysozyme family protein
MKVGISPSLNEYDVLFKEMVINHAHDAEINQAIAKIKQGKDEYVLAALCNKALPWYAIGIAHYMEANCDFTAHIHCGDSLKHRTVNEPIGRPLADPNAGKGMAYTWQESCLDWMIMKGWNKWKDWGIPDILYRLEANNGFGYRKREVPTPYLWSYTSIYVKGKYVSDGKFDENAVSKQVGAAILLKILSSI